MTDDFFDPNKPAQDCHSCEMARQQMNRNRLKEFFIDPASGQFSMSRICLGIMNLTGVLVSCWLAYKGGQGQWIAAILAPIAASDAGVYYASTRKEWHREGE